MEMDGRGDRKYNCFVLELINKFYQNFTYAMKLPFMPQIICNMLSLDSRHDPEVLSINGAAAALILSDIPWSGPIGMQVLIYWEGSA